MTEPSVLGTVATTTGLVGGAVLARPLAILDGPPPSQGVWGIPDMVLSTLSGVLSMPGDLIDVGAACVSSAIVPPGLGFPAARLMVAAHLGLPHAHAPPPAPPLLGIGPTVLLGAVNVLAGGLPMLRTGDVGFAPTCPAPVFRIFTGSASVYVGGKRAARLLDITEHCPLVRSRLAGTGPPAAAARAFSAAMDHMTLAGIATGAIAHGAAAVHDLADDAVPVEVAREAAVGEVVQASLGAVQAVADTTLSALHNVIGLPPPLGSCGAGVAIPVGAPSLVMVGGLPMPELGTITNGYVARWVRNLRALAIRARRRRAQGRSWRCAVFGEPVDAVTGHVFADHLDVDLGDGLRFSRRYDSRARDRVGECGRGMRHGYERELDVWLHRVRYVDHEGVSVEFPPFRGRDRLAVDGYVVVRQDAGRYEVSHAGETMVFAATPGVRAARLDAIRTERGTITIERDGGGRLRALRLGDRALVVRRDAASLIVAIHDERGVERAALAYEDGCLVATRDAEAHEQRLAYDAAHRLTEWRDARGYRFTWRYDADGRCVHASGEDGQWSCDLAYARNATAVTHASGLVETLHFDAYGTVLRITRSDGAFRLLEQDETGRVVRERDAAGRVVEWLYDETGAHVGRRDRFGNALVPEHEVTRDTPGPLVLPEPPAALAAQLGVDSTAAGPAPAVPAELEALASWALPPPDGRDAWSAERDGLGRVVRAVDPRGRAVSLRRDGAGNVVSVVDRDGRETRVLVTGWNLAGSCVDPLGRRIDVTYTPTEEVRSYRDARGVLTEYGRDGADRLTSITRGGRLVETYAYDAGDRLLEKRDALGALVLRVTHGDDALPARIELAEGDAVELEHDACGRVARARQGDHDAHLVRDAQGGVLEDRCGERGLRRRSVGGIETITLLDRFETRIERTGELIFVRDPTGRLSSFDLSARGRVVRHLGNGTREILAFDPAGNLEGRLAHRRASDGALASWAVRYERSGEGDLLGVWDTARGERRFEVDAAHRLEAEADERGARHAFTHDAGDDVVARGAELTTEGLLRSTADERFEHDARGRVCLRTDALGRRTRYHHDSLDQLVRAELPDGSVWRGGYDGLGRLRRFGVAGRETTLHWDGARIAAEERHDGALRVHVYLDARALVPFAFVDYASADAEPESGRSFFVFHDASGMPTQIEDASGRTVWWADRVDPYGTITLHEGAEVDYALRWPGHVFDPALGLHHNRFRAYDPRLARYLQPDPIGHAGSPHGLYAYAPNPLLDVDLEGLACPGRRTHGVDESAEGRPLRPDPPGTLRNVLGRLYDAVTGAFVNDPRARGPRRPTLHRTRVEISDERQASIAGSRAAREHLAARSRELAAAERAERGGRTHEAEQARARARRESEQLGVLASEAEMRRRYPDAEPMHQGEGPGTFDGVWRNHSPPPSYIVVESKGGGAGESSSRLLANGERAQQGTPEYRDDVARQMVADGERRGDRALRDAGQAILDGGSDVAYLGVHQSIRSDGSLGPIHTYSYRQSVRTDGTVSRAGGRER